MVFLTAGPSFSIVVLSVIVVERASFTPPALTTSCCSSPYSSPYSSCSYWTEAEAAEKLDDVDVVVVVLVSSRVREGKEKERRKRLVKRNQDQVMRKKTA